MTMPVIRFGEVPMPPDATHVDVTVVTTPPVEGQQGCGVPTIHFGERVAQPVVVPTTSRTDLLGTGEDWEQVRDYVVRKIEERWGAFPRNSITEASIFKSFVSRWGELAMPIARAACEDYGCLWQSAPISVNRFCKASDPFFAAILAQRVSVSA